MTDQEEAYLSLLCLRDSTARIAQLYWTYIELRSLASYAPPVLILMLNVLCEKRQSLQDKLLANFPEEMSAEQWHLMDEQIDHLPELSEDTQEALQRICANELQMLQLVSAMMQQ